MKPLPRNYFEIRAVLERYPEDGEYAIFADRAAEALAHFQWRELRRICRWLESHVCNPWADNLRRLREGM